MAHTEAVIIIPPGTVAKIVNQVTDRILKELNVQKPSLGRKVLYTLTEQDVRWIDQNVPSAGRNPVKAGQVFPAEVVAVFSPESPSANLKVLLDGGPGAEFWATSRAEGEGPGHWSWPPRV